jgi:hypothetical protein
MLVVVLQLVKLLLMRMLMQTPTQM